MILSSLSSSGTPLYSFIAASASAFRWYVTKATPREEPSGFVRSSADLTVPFALKSSCTSACVTPSARLPIRSFVPIVSGFFAGAPPPAAAAAAAAAATAAAAAAHHRVERRLRRRERRRAAAAIATTATPRPARVLALLLVRRRRVPRALRRGRLLHGAALALPLPPPPRS